MIYWLCKIPSDSHYFEIVKNLLKYTLNKYSIKISKYHYYLDTQLPSDPCPKADWRACHASRQCVRLSAVCDDVFDCTHGEDELGCGECHPYGKGKVGSLPSHQLLWFLASIASTRDSNPDLPAPCPVALPLGHQVGIFMEAWAWQLASL